MKAPLRKRLQSNRREVLNQLAKVETALDYWQDYLKRCGSGVPGAEQLLRARLVLQDLYEYQEALERACEANGE